MPNVTVLIPTHNRLKYVNAAIDSALKQGADVIVYDDGSTDGSYEMLSKRNDITLVRSEEASGSPSEPYNEMIKVCTTDYFIPLSSDDMLAPGAVQLLTENVGDYDWLYCDLMVVDEYDDILTTWRYDKFPRDYDGMVEYMRINTSSPAPFVGIIRKGFLTENEIGFYDFESTHYTSDMRTIIEWMKHGIKIGYLPIPLWYYRKHKNSLTGTVSAVEMMAMRDELIEILGVRGD